MEHPLAKQYGLTARELLDAVNKRFRLKVALEGAVAEVQMEKKITALVGSAVERYENYDQDGHPDFGIWLPGLDRELLAECKNVRDHEQAYREGGKAVAYRVETQKTRTSKSDPLSRFYGVEHFHILGVCLGKKTGNWSDFMFARVVDLICHAKHANKLAVFQRVPLAGSASPPWYDDLGELLRRFSDPPCAKRRSTKRS